MTNKEQLIENYGTKALKIAVFVAAIFFVQTVANAQTALEQQCFNAVQGKVAWNQAGNTVWGEGNIRRLCQGTTNPGATIACFQAQIKQHGEWNRGIAACLPERGAVNLPDRIQEEKTAVRPAAIENVRTLTFKNNASIQATLHVGAASSGQLNIGESKTVNIKESIGTPLQITVTMRIPNPDYFVIYHGTISGDNRATGFCFEAKGDVMKPIVQPCDGTQAAEARKIEFTNQAGFIAKPTLSYFVNGSPRSISTDDTSLGINRKIYIPTDADRDKNIILSTTYFSLQGKHEFDRIRIDRNSNFSPCYKFWGDTLRPKMGLCSVDTSSRRIRLRNNAGYNARMKVTYYDKGQSGADVGTAVRTNIIEVLQSDTIVIPQGTSEKPVDVNILLDAGDGSLKDIYTTNVSANFKGELCFKTE